MAGRNGIQAYVSPLKAWVISAFCFNSIIASVFGVLAWLVYQAFEELVQSVKTNADGSLVTSGNSTIGAGTSNNGTTPAVLPLGLDKGAWSDLFMGVAVSAAFALILTIGFHVLAVVLIFINFKSLGHPTRKFARAFLVASAWMTSLHVLNIAIVFQCFGPTVTSVQHTYKVTFNTTLLYTCVAFGYLSTLMYIVCGILVFFWREYPGLLIDTNERNDQQIEMQL